MWKQTGRKPLLLVIMDHARRLAILTQAYENLGHRGEQAIFETILMAAKSIWHCYSTQDALILFAS
jgi:hypothetical protein